MIKLEILPAKDGLVKGQENTVNLLLRASAQQNKSANSNLRSSLNLSLVIDSSGSMYGRPFAEAKKCAEILIDRLGEKDQLSVVTYSDSANLVFPMTKVSNKALLKHLISGISAGGMTALHDGWSLGANQAMQSSKKNNFSRILLLSDGQANRGITDLEMISSDCKNLAEEGVSTSTYGLGLNFNETLMTEMARLGQGQSHYGQTADDLMDPFNEEFDLMQAIIGRQIKLNILSKAGISYEVLNDYPRDLEGNFILPDLAHDSDLWALIKVNIAEDICNKPIGSLVELLSAQLEFADIEGVKFKSDTIKYNAKIVSKKSFEAQKINKTVEQRSIELRAASLQDQAYNAAKYDDWVRVDQVIKELEAIACYNEWLKASLKNLKIYSNDRNRERFSKEVHYKSRHMRQRRVFREESIDKYDALLESLAPSYLQRKLEQGKKKL